MKRRDKQTPEVPAADTFHSLPEFPAKPTGFPHAGDPHSEVALRQKAEAQVRQREETAPEELAELSPETLRRILHELRVHQIELEMQNEQLRQVQAALEAERARYFHIFDLAPVGYVTLNAEGLIVEANLTAANLLGMARRELTGKPLSNFIIREDRDLHYQLRKRLADSGATQTCEVRMGKTAGTAFWAHLSATAVPDPDGGPACRVVLSDISERKQAEDKLQCSHERLALAQRASGAGLWDWDMASGMLNWTPEMFLLFGLDPETSAATFETWRNRVHPEDVVAAEEHIHAAVRDHTRLENDYRIVLPSGEVRWIHASGSTSYDSGGQPLRMAGLCIDTTERKRTEVAIHLALVEKTALIKEIHHRVKNNLAIMASLINMEMRQIKHPEALTALANTKARLLSMSLLHEMLYRSGRMDRVEVKGYLENLCGQLEQSLGISAQGVQIRSRLPATLTLEMDQAVPCGLIVSELVTNALKYAFPNDRHGEIMVELMVEEPDSTLLRVGDNGIGLPDGLNIEQVVTVGLTLVKALTRQLGGTLDIRRERGTLFEIRFPLLPATIY